MALQNDYPGEDAIPITPADGANLASPVRFLIIGTAGTLKVDTLNGQTRTYPGVPAGEFRVSVRKVYATGTSATNIVGVI